MTRSKRFLGGLGVATLVLLLAEGLLRLAWMFMDQPDPDAAKAVQFMEEHHCRHDDELGWVNLPGKRIDHFYGPGAHITINADGFRGREDYLGRKPADRTRVVCLGDSFTLGYGVDDRATWPAWLEQLRPELQCINMGQGGYSLGQCWLWFQRDFDKLDADLLVVALILDDIARLGAPRMINGYARPTVRWTDGALQVGNQPVPDKIETGEPLVERGKRNSAIVRSISALLPEKEPPRPPTGDEMMETALRILADLHAKAKARDIPCVVVLLPELRELADAAARNQYALVARGIAAHAGQQGYGFISLHNAFNEVGPERIESLYLREAWFHYSSDGNRLVATQLAQQLGPLKP